MSSTATRPTASLVRGRRDGGPTVFSICLESGGAAEVSGGYAVLPGRRLLRQVLGIVGGGDAQRLGKRGLGKVVAVEAGNVVFVGVGDGLLSLDHLEVVGDAGLEAVLRQGEFAIGEIAGVEGDADLVAIALQIEDGRADL